MSEVATLENDTALLGEVLDVPLKPTLEIRWQTLPDGAWISALLLTPGFRLEAGFRWWDHVPDEVGFRERLLVVAGMVLEQWFALPA